MSRLSLRALGRARHAETLRGARGRRHQGLHGDAARRRDRRTFADAGAGGVAVLWPFSRTRGQRQAWRAVGDPRAEDRAGETRETWVLMRDAAVMALLYGSGLRISEALGLKRRDIPRPGAGDVL